MAFVATMRSCNGVGVTECPTVENLSFKGGATVSPHFEVREPKTMSAETLCSIDNGITTALSDNDSVPSMKMSVLNDTTVNLSLEATAPLDETIVPPMSTEILVPPSPYKSVAGAPNHTGVSTPPSVPTPIEVHTVHNGSISAAAQLNPVIPSYKSTTALCDVLDLHHATKRTSDVFNTMQQPPKKAKVRPDPNHRP